MLMCCYYYSSRRRQTICALVTGVQPWLFRSVAADRQLVGRGPVFLRVAIVPLSGRGHLSGPGRLPVRWARSSVHLAGAGFCQSHGARKSVVSVKGVSVCLELGGCL